MSWPVAPLTRVVRTMGGGTPSKSNREYWNGDIPWVSPKDMSRSEIDDATDHITRAAVAKSATQLIPAGSVLIVVRSGILAHKLPIAITRVPVTLNQDMKALVCGDALVPEFLAYVLAHKESTVLSGYVKKGATVHSINTRSFGALEIPLPPISEQRRIVEILDQADALRKGAREADAKAARVLPALFLKMFGDPTTNPKGWPVKPLGDAIEEIEAGWSARSELRERQPGEFGVLKVSAVTAGTFSPDEFKTVSSVPNPESLVTPKRGDLLFSRANTRELVAATCLVDADYPYLFLPDKLWRLVPRDGVATTPYLRELMACEVVRDKFRAFSSGSSGSMLNVSQAAVLRTEVPLAPYGLQTTFAYYTWEVLGLLRAIRQACAQMDTLRSALLQRAFTGQLTAKWRATHMQELLVEMQEQTRLLNLPAPTTVSG